MNSYNSKNTEKEKSVDRITNLSNNRNDKKRNLIIGTILVVALVITAFLVVADNISKSNYEKGVQAIIRCDYDDAIKYLGKSKMDGVQDQLAFIFHYQKAMKAHDDEDYIRAYEELLLIHENYHGYDQVRELTKTTLAKICKSLLQEAKHLFERGDYIGAFDSLTQTLEYDEDYAEALQLLDYYKENAQVMEAEKVEAGYFLVHDGSVKQREYVNINKWHDAGYTGKGLTILHDDTGNTMHSLNCLDIIQTILPEAKIIRGFISGKTNSHGVEEALVTYFEAVRVEMSFDEFIVKHNVSIINNSKTGGKGNVDSDWSVWMKRKIKEYNLIGFGAAGNAGDIDNRFYGSFIMVSGVYLKDDGTILNYGAKGDIDFSMFMGFQSGTSFASPFLCGMAGLLREKYPEISQEEVYEYFKNHSQKLGDEGKNIDYGWGIPILGNPDE